MDWRAIVTRAEILSALAEATKETLRDGNEDVERDAYAWSGTAARLRFEFRLTQDEITELRRRIADAIEVAVDAAEEWWKSAEGASDALAKVLDVLTGGDASPLLEYVGPELRPYVVKRTMDKLRE